jgi:hypothetical protein
MALAATDNGEDEPLVEESERSKITLKDLWLDVQFWNLNLVDICKSHTPLITVGR